jgi:hypothetical protein
MHSSSPHLCYMPYPSHPPWPFWLYIGCWNCVLKDFVTAVTALFGLLIYSHLTAWVLIHFLVLSSLSKILFSLPSFHGMAITCTGHVYTHLQSSETRDTQFDEVTPLQQYVIHFWLLLTATGVTITASSDNLCWEGQLHICFRIWPVLLKQEFTAVFTKSPFNLISWVSGPNLHLHTRSSWTPLVYRSFNSSYLLMGSFQQLKFCVNVSLLHLCYMDPCHPPRANHFSASSCRSQWPLGLRHEISSPSQTMVS